MAKILEKDPTTYSKERDGFIRDLQHFHDTRGTPFRRCPTLGGKEVDLYLLYSLVTAQGGWMKVNSRNEWNAVFEQFNFPAKCVNSGVALKQIYLRYLDRYEKVHFLGEDAERGSDDDEESRHKRWSARALHSVPLTYNYQQHNIADSIRSYNGLSDNLYKSSDYDRLALSLISPLPNEQDFAVNVCTLLCNEGKHTLKLEKCPRLVDYLLAHTGVYNHGSLRTVFTEVYSKIRKHSLSSFWYDALEKSAWFDLADERNFPEESKSKSVVTTPPVKSASKLSDEKTKSEVSDVRQTLESLNKNPSVNVGECSKSLNNDKVVTVGDDSDSDCELFASEECVSETITKGKGFKLKLEPSDSELFCMGLTLGTQDYVGQRVLQIAQILRNLSFTEDNMPVLAKNKTFFRFLLLCVGSKWNSIHQLGLDMLSNIASEISVKDQKDRLTECLMSFVTNGLHSEDRVIVIACLEILNKLSQKEINEEYLLRSLEKRTYAQVCSFLTLHDVMLLIYTLECLYSLSSLGERACNFIVDVHGIIDTLVSLVTVEGKSYGPKACIGMKLVETVSGLPSSSTTVVQMQTTATSVQTTTAMTASSITSTPARVVSTPAVLRSVTATPPKLITTVVASVTQPTPTQTNSPSVNPQQFIQQQHAHQQAIQENEQFALAYLRATYEPCSSGKIEQQELYKQYLSSCAKIGRRGVIAPLHFPRCVRSVFGGTVGPNPIKGSGDANQYYDGIRARVVPLIINFQSSLVQPATPQKTTPVRRGAAKALTVSATQVQPASGADSSSVEMVPASPASPILKAQLSAPPKPKESPSKVDVKSQVLAHPHLSQALLGSSGTTTPGTSKESSAGQSNTSLIKSLLATKVNECMIPMSMKTTALAPAANQDSQPVVAQVAQRQQQQRLLAQQNQQQTTPALQTFTAVNKKLLPKPQPKTDPKQKLSRVNGARIENENADSVTSTSQILENHMSTPTTIGGVNSAFRGRREPPQPPPPPLAPLSCGSMRAKTPRMDIEDSDSTGNNSLASSTGISCSNVGLGGGISSTEDGENSLTSFEGILLNGIPNSLDIDAPCNEDSNNSKDSIRNSSNSNKKPLMLADLLEKKVDKEVPVLNGIVGKELRIGEKGLELVDNHISKILNKENSVDSKEVSVIVSSDESRTLEQMNSVVNSVCVRIEEDTLDNSEVRIGVKRPAEDDISDIGAKRPNVTSSVIVSNNVNGNGSVDSPKPESIDSSNGDDSTNVSVSATAANLYAALAADALEDEDEELLQQETVPPAPVIEEQPPQPQMQVVQSAPIHQVYVGGQGDASQQLMITTAPRQIIVSQAQIQPSQQVLITTGGITLQQGTATATGIKTATGHQGLPMLVQTSAGQQRSPIVLSQGNSAPIIVSQGPQGQVQLVASGSQAGQYVLSTGGAQGQTHYMVAQPQQALVQGQTQTVLVAQTPQQQGTGSKTIIILQPQATTNTATHHQKVVVTPQGQQVVVTQVQRPILQSSSVSNNNNNNNIPALVPSTQTVIQNSNTVIKTTQGAMVQNSSQNQQIMANVSSNLGKVLVTSQAQKIENKTSRPGTPVIALGDDKTAKIPAVASTSQQSSSNPTRDYSHPYICEWRGCQNPKKFKSANEVYMHACEEHCPSGSEEIQCLWDRCDSMKRKRFSLMTHLQDRHCSTEIMKIMCMRRKQLSQSGRTEIPPPSPAPPHPGYAPDAALHAIKRHALEFVNPKELQDDNEGPVTKSIRLTASLILRNLVIYSNNSKRYLRQYEPHLAGVALSNVESSRTIAQLLYDMNENTNRR